MSDVFSSDQSTDNGTEASSSPDAANDLLASITNEDGSPKYASVSDALKGLLHAQEHIPKIQKENQSLREELDKRLSAEAVLEKIKASDKPDEKPSTEFSAEALKDIVHKELEAKTAQERMIANRQAVSDTLAKKYGDRVGDILKAKANEVGMTIEALGDLSASNPKAVLAMFGNASTQTDVPMKSSSSVNTEVEINPSERNYAYWSKLRRDNPAEYRSRYLQMFEDRERLGSNFF